MNTKIRNIGNSKGVIINTKDLYKAELDSGDQVNVKAEKDKIILTKIKEK